VRIQVHAHLLVIGPVVSGKLKQDIGICINNSMKTYYVYLLTDPRNNDEVFYCGKGNGHRWRSHIGHWSGNGENNPTANKIKKIQAEGLQPGVIFLHNNIEDENLAYKLEEDYIKENYDKLTNICIDARPPSNKGKPSTMKGKKHSEESKEKIRNSLLGQKRGSYNEQWRKAISDSLKGDKHPMFNKPANNRTAILETTTNATFTNQVEAANILGIRQGDIANCLAGRQKTVKGYVFKYHK